MFGPKALRPVWFAFAVPVLLSVACGQAAFAQAVPGVVETTDLSAWARHLHQGLGPSADGAILRRSGSVEWTIWMREPDQAYLAKCHWRRGTKIVVVFTRFATEEEARADVGAQVETLVERPHDRRTDLRSTGVEVDEGTFVESRWKQEECGLWGERATEFRVGSINVNVWEITNSSPLPDTAFLRRLAALTAEAARNGSAGAPSADGDFGDRQIRTALWRRLGQEEGPLARKCFDETYAKLGEPRNAEMKERIERAAYQEHMVETAAEMAAADDFDPKWMEAAKRIGGSGGAAQRIADKLVRLLPPPLGTLIGLSQKAYRLSRGVNEQVVLPILEGRLYEAYVQERAQRPNDPPADVLKEASTHVGGWESVKASLLASFPGANEQARETAMAAYVAARFDFLAKVREVAADKPKHIAEAWREAVDDVARIKMNVLACMSM